MKNKTNQSEQDLFQMAEQEKIILPDTLYRKVDSTLGSLPKRRRTFKMTWKKSVILAAALIAVCSCTVMAAVGAMQQRMEAMNEQEIEDYFLQIHTSRLGADNYNRPLTDAERSRMEALTASYEQEALFPEKSLMMISAPEKYSGTGVAFYKNTSTFFLPKDTMDDEGLLQIIDFLHKRDYSLRTMNEKITADEAPSIAEQLAEEKTPKSAGAVPYTGNLAVRSIAAGQNCIFLLGKNAVHRMEIGSGSSELFFDDFENDTYIDALYEDKKGNIYLALSEQTDSANDDAECVTIAGKTYRPALWVLDSSGNVSRKIDLAALPLEEPDRIHIVRQMVVDEQGHIYLRAAGVRDALLIVLDKEGDYLKKIVSEAYCAHDMGGLGIGRDGKIYTQIQSEDQMGIASVDLSDGSLDEIYPGIVPDGTIMLDIIAPGSRTDFIFWGYDGIFTYNLGEEKAECILPAYEAPCKWENVMRCALPDGRIVFGACTEYRREGEEIFSIPEKICFYYESCAK